VGLLLLATLSGCSLGLNQPTATTAPATVAPTGNSSPASGQPLSQPLATASAAPSTAPASATAAAPAGAALPDVASVAAKVRPATVLVSNIAQGRPTRTNPTGSDVPQGAGTGFIIDPSGIIVTNAHVVEGAQKLTVQLPPPDGRTFDATLVGAASNNDLAVLRINGQNLPTVPLGTSSNLQIGEWVVAIGNALALEGGPTVTAGVVSATGRDATEPGSTQGQAGPTLYDLIQTDAAINPGNSGGPLVNMRGEVVGINTLGTTEAQGIGFAISIDTAKPIIDQLIQTGKVSTPYLGVSTVSITASVAAANGLPRNDGVYVQQVVAGTPAAQGGVQQGDIIFGIDNDVVKDTTTFQKALFKHKPGDRITLKINRGGTETTVQVTLGEKPAASATQPTS
jgi:S1-C subfamily serine protease